MAQSVASSTMMNIIGDLPSENGDPFKSPTASPSKRSNLKSGKSTASTPSPVSRRIVQQTPETLPAPTVKHIAEQFRKKPHLQQSSENKSATSGSRESSPVRAKPVQERTAVSATTTKSSAFDLMDESSSDEENIGEKRALVKSIQKGAENKTQQQPAKKTKLVHREVVASESEEGEEDEDMDVDAGTEDEEEEDDDEPKGGIEEDEDDEADDNKFGNALVSKASAKRDFEKKQNAVKARVKKDGTLSRRKAAQPKAKDPVESQLIRESSSLGYSDTVDCLLEYPGDDAPERLRERNFIQVLRFLVSSQYYNKNNRAKEAGMPCYNDITKYKAEMKDLENFMASNPTLESFGKIENFPYQSLIVLRARVKALLAVFRKMSTEGFSLCENSMKLSQHVKLPVNLFGGHAAWTRFFALLVNDASLSVTAKQTLKTNCCIETNGASQGKKTAVEVIVFSSVLMEIIVYIYGCPQTPGYSIAGTGMPNCTNEKCGFCSEYFRQLREAIPQTTKKWIKTHPQTHRTVMAESPSTIAAKPMTASVSLEDLM